MKNNKSFISYIIILLSNMFCYYIFNWMNNDMLTLSPISNEAYSLLKLGLLPVASIILASVYFIAGSRISTYEIVRKTYLSLIAFIFIFAFILIPGYLHSPPTVDYASPMRELANKWILTTFYIFLYLWTPITLLTFYGYTNERLSFKEASKMYPVFAIIGLIFSQMIIPPLLPLLMRKHVGSLILGPGIIALILLFLSLRTFVKINKSESIPHEQSNSRIGITFILMLSLMTISMGFTKYISVTCWDCGVKLYKPFPADYWHTMNIFSSLKTLSNFMAILILAFLSIYLQQHRIKGWKHFCYAGATVTSFITLSLIFFSFFADPNTQVISPPHISVISTTIMKVGSNYQVFVSTVMYPTFFCLMQLVFIPIPLKYRFKAKILVDIILSNAGFVLAVVVQQLMQPDSHSFIQFSLYFSVIFIIGTALRFYTIHYISKRVEFSAIKRG